MHSTLQRQINKHCSNTEAVTKDPSLTNLFEIISKTYEQYDEDRKMLEHSLELSSRELTEQNKRLREELEKSKQQSEEFEKLNKFMMGRELKMIALKEEIAQLKEQLSSVSANPNAVANDTQQK